MQPGSIHSMPLLPRRWPRRSCEWNRATCRTSSGFASQRKADTDEHKIDWGPGYRIYLAKDGLRIIVLLGGGTKKGQQKDIERAIALWNDYKQRKTRETKRR